MGTLKRYWRLPTFNLRVSNLQCWSPGKQGIGTVLPLTSWQKWAPQYQIASTLGTNPKLETDLQTKKDANIKFLSNRLEKEDQQEGIYNHSVIIT